MKVIDETEREEYGNFILRNEKFFNREASRYLFNKDFVEDCVHDAVVSVADCYENFKILKEEVDKIKYFNTVIKHRAIKYNAEYGGYENKASLNLEDFAEIIADNSQIDPCDIMIQNEMVEELNAIVRAMRDVYSAPLLLRGELRMSYKEIAESLNISEETARKRYERARKRLIKEGGKRLLKLLAP
jgi:RNA polymerase sigma factor (sigma-70 family)